MQNRAEWYRLDTRPQHRTPYCNHCAQYDPTDLSQRMMANYRLIRALKPGGMSMAINIVEERSTRKRYIEKQIANDDGRGLTRVEAEITTLRQISQYGWTYNLNTMLHYAPGHHATHIILEYCEGGDLQQATDRLKERNAWHAESFIWHVLVSCINALSLLHTGPTDRFGRQDSDWNTVCHLDIKPENIYLQDVGEIYPRVVLGDFGCSVSNSDVLCGRADLQSAPAYTPGWEAPEMSRGRYTYGTKTDSWQLGCVIQTMCLLRSSPDMRALQSGVPCGQRYSQELNSFVTKITVSDLHRRRNSEDMMDVAQQNLRRSMLWGRGQR